MTKIRIIASDKSWIEGKAVEQLKSGAELRGVVSAVGLPDLHPGKGIPVGAAFITRGIIYPHIVGNDIGCGMSFFKIDVPPRKVKIDKWVKKFQKIGSLSDIELSEDLDSADGLLPDVAGTIGGGNHFAEFQVLENIFESESFEEEGFGKKSLYLLVHSGSRGIGQSILDEFIRKYKAQNGIDPLSKEGEEYFFKHDNAVAWAGLNRLVVARKICSYVGLPLKDSDHILNLTHNSIEKKSMDGGLFYLHRKGASPGDKGVTIIPGSRGSFSYLVNPVESSKEAAFSLAHGAGRKWDRNSCKGKIGNKHTKTSLLKTDLKSWVVCTNKALLYQEVPEAYKNIEQVVKDLEDANLIQTIASFRPLLTLKI